MGAMFLASALNRGIHPPEILKNVYWYRGEMLLFRALAKNMAPMTNDDESPTNRLTLFWLNISLFIVSTLWYGFPIHGCIDGFSRKMLWLQLSRSNNNPQVILRFFVDAVDACGGCPRKLRTDCWTENGLVAAAQCYFTDNEQAHIY